MSPIIRAIVGVKLVAALLTGCAPDESLFGPVIGTGGAPVGHAPVGDVAASSTSGSGGSGGSGGAGPVLLAGVQENAALPFGWTECWAEPFSGIDTPVADIIAHCQGSLMALGCRPKGSDVFSLLAMAPRADVLFDTNPPTNPAKVHQANGVGWYFNEYGWGFAPAGDEVILGNCDVVDVKGGAPGVDGALRMCVKFHSSPEWATHPGFRCGKLWEGAAPGFGVAYERVVLSAD